MYHLFDCYEGNNHNICKTDKTNNNYNFIFINYKLQTIILMTKLPNHLVMHRLLNDQIVKLSILNRQML